MFTGKSTNASTELKWKMPTKISSTANCFSQHQTLFLLFLMLFFISSFFSCSNLTLFAFAFSFSLALWFFVTTKKEAENIPLIACVMKECHAHGVHIVNDFSLALLVWIVDLFRWCRGCCQRPGTGFNVVFSFCLYSKVEFTTKTQYTTCLQS